MTLDMNYDALTVTLPRAEIERLRKEAVAAARKLRKDAVGAAKYGPNTKRNATWVAACNAKAVEREYIVRVYDELLGVDAVEGDA